MGDIDGSSGAAQRAHEDDEESTGQGGFFGRIVGVLSPGAAVNGHDEAEITAPEPPRHGMMNLRRMRVEDVAIPSADIVAVPDTVTADELVEVFRESGMTRIPVYEGTLDTPVGFVHLKDFALTHGFNGKNTPFDLHSMLRDLLFVPPSMPIGVLLTKMQAERRHMALVIDEYGGVDGLVTIEDLLEQVVGEIEDEHDTDEDRTWVQEKPGVYLALAKTPLDEFEEEIGRSLTDSEEVDEEEIDTLGGLVIMISGRVPARGEVVEHPDGAEFEVVDADPRRIKRLRVRLPDDSH
ncbi:hemolysin family protein [Marinibacterium profundimaris]|uniref:Conjugal transfer protein n=1 Tax=Marinibacterium profundimaris TaxID=1679460 RepID=A0A225NE52_9RHOB|nr:hemolysin family protein [Marinibacterium profundimaris]OWU70541.1 conjugal transfer protein [Marinibacterium profundimaris]